MKSVLNGDHSMKATEREMHMVAVKRGDHHPLLLLFIMLHKTVVTCFESVDEILQKCDFSNESY